MRRGRRTSWFASIVLPLVVVAGLFVMHGLDNPSAHQVGATHVDNHVAESVGSPVANTMGDDAMSANAMSDETESGATSGANRLGAMHVVVACLAVLAVAGVLALSWCGARPVALVRMVAERGRDVVVSTRESCARPAWMRLAVMLC